MQAYGGAITDTVVIYDSVYGGLRLTENLFRRLWPVCIERIELGRWTLPGRRNHQRRDGSSS